MDLFEEVKKLIEEGMGACRISQALGLSKKQAETWISKVRKKYPNLRKASQANTHLDLIDPEEMCSKVSELMDQGMGQMKVAQALGITPGSASHWIAKVRTKSNRITRLDTVRAMLDQGEYDTYDVAKRFFNSPVTTSNTIKKIEGVYSPVDDWVKKAAKYGVKFSHLQEVLKIKTTDKAKEIIKTSFPDCFISERNLENGDILLTPIPDNSNDFERLEVDLKKKNKLFKAYVSPNKNYMFIKFNDELPGDEVKIWNFTDLHLGSKACRTGLLISCIDKVSSEDSNFIQLGGDVGENNSRNSAGHPFDQYLSPTEQASYTVKLFAPVGHLITDYIEGNHEERTSRFSDFKMSHLIGEMLKVPTFDHGILIEYEWRGIIKRQFHTHRYRNVIDPMAIKREVLKLMAKYTCKIDWFSSGHTHEAFMFPLESPVLISGRGFDVERSYIVNGGSFTADTGTYSEQYGHSPKDLTYIAFDDKGNHRAGSLPIKSI